MSNTIFFMLETEVFYYWYSLRLFYHANLGYLKLYSNFAVNFFSHNIEIDILISLRGSNKFQPLSCHKSIMLFENISLFVLFSESNIKKCVIWNWCELLTSHQFFQSNKFCKWFELWSRPIMRVSQESIWIKYENERVFGSTKKS